MMKKSIPRTESGEITVQETKELIKRALKGDSDADEELYRRIYLEDTETANDEEITGLYLDYLKETAASGNTVSMIFLGSIFASGDWVDQDMQKSFQYFEAAGEAGESYAYESIAQEYFNGENVSQDYTKAAEYYIEKAKYYKMIRPREYMEHGLLGHREFQNEEQTE